MKNTIHIAPVGVEVRVIFTNDLQRERQLLSDKFGFPKPPDLSDARGLHSCDYETIPGVNYIILGLDPDLNTIAHECLHAVEKIDKYYGIKSEEFRCYTLGYLVDEVSKLAGY